MTATNNYCYMRDMKFDVDIILRNCERFGVKVEKGENLHGVTMNGNPFDVTDEMDKALGQLKLTFRNLT